MTFSLLIFSNTAAHPSLLVFPSWQVRGVSRRVVPPAWSPLSPHRSSCFHTTVSSSWAPVGLHAASLITAPRAFLELNLFCGTIHHKKAEYVLWIFRNKLRHYKKGKKYAIKEGVWPIIHRLTVQNPRSGFYSSLLLIQSVRWKLIKRRPNEKIWNMWFALES